MPASLLSRVCFALPTGLSMARPAVRTMKLDRKPLYIVREILRRDRRLAVAWKPWPNMSRSLAVGVGTPEGPTASDSIRIWPDPFGCRAKLLPPRGDALSISYNAYGTCHTTKNTLKISVSSSGCFKHAFFCALRLFLGVDGLPIAAWCVLNRRYHSFSSRIDVHARRQLKTG